MNIRRATMEDALDILAWRNDPLTRRMSRNTHGIAAEDHLRWLSRVLKSDTHVLLIAVSDGAKVGMARLDLLEPGTWEISINLNPAERKKGHSHGLLAGALGEIAKRMPTKVIAEIRRENEASRHLFEKHGFRWVSEDGAFNSFVLSDPGQVEKPGNVL